MENYCTVIVDNNKGRHRFLKNEHGLSLYIDYEGERILFDFGPSKVLKENGELLKIEFSRLTNLVCSHAHYDHTNGLPSIIDDLKTTEIHLSKNFFEDKYSKLQDTGIINYLGPNFSKRMLIENDLKINLVNDLYKISESIYLVSTFNNQERPKGNFLIERNGALIADDFSDEIAMIIKKESSLTLIVGCSHPGIINIINKVNSLFDTKVKTVIGGTHLSKIDEHSGDNISKELKDLGIENTYLCHCSGSTICSFLDKNGINQTYLHCGDTFLL